MADTEVRRGTTSSREYRGKRKTWLDSYRKYEFPVETRWTTPTKPKQAGKDERAT